MVDDDAPALRGAEEVVPLFSTWDFPQESEDAETGPELETGRDAQQTQEEESESEDQQGEAEVSSL